MRNWFISGEEGQFNLTFELTKTLQKVTRESMTPLQSRDRYQFH
jgi:hypothetical protein